jgi:hypothetical protein
MPEADRVARAAHFVGDEFGSFETNRLGPGAHFRLTKGMRGPYATVAGMLAPTS